MKFLPGKRTIMVFLAVAAVMMLPLAAQADVTYGFERITNNGSPDTAGQYFVDVSDPSGLNNVLFTFRNVGPIASFIDGVYFMDGTLLGISSIINGIGVAFSNPADPASLPSQNTATPPFVTHVGFSADNDPGAGNGVNPGEQVGIQFDLISGQEYANTLAALIDGTLRIGIHVQGISTAGFSDSFVNTPGGGTPPIPVPPTVWLMGSGLVGLGLMAWRRRKQ